MVVRSGGQDISGEMVGDEIKELQRELKNGLTPLELTSSLNFVTQRVQENWLTCTSDPDFIMGLHHYGRIGHSGTTATATTEPCLG